MIWRIISVFFFIIGCYFSIFSAFLFDAPGSNVNPFTISLFLFIISIPILSICGIITGSYIYPTIIMILFLGGITLLLLAISSVPFTTIKQKGIKHIINDFVNR